MSKFPQVIQGAKHGNRAVVSMLLCLITGHAFIGSYTARFRPDKPTDCPCGVPLRTVEHVITSCPLHAAARQEHLHPIDHDLSTLGPKLLGTLQLKEEAPCFNSSRRPKPAHAQAGYGTPGKPGPPAPETMGSPTPLLAHFRTYVFVHLSDPTQVRYVETPRYKSPHSHSATSSPAPAGTASLS
jgi:hypothetical protein